MSESKSLFLQDLAYLQYILNRVKFQFCIYTGR